MDKKVLKKVIIKYFIIIAILTIFSKSLYNISLPKVELIEGKRDSLKIKLKGNAEIKASKIDELLSLCKLKIDKVLVNEKQFVEMGEDLIKVNKASFDKELKKIEEKYLIAKKKYELILKESNSLNKNPIEEKTMLEEKKKLYESNIKLFEVGGISKNDLEKSKNEYIISKDNYDNKLDKIEIDKISKDKNLLEAELELEENKKLLSNLKKIANNSYIIKSHHQGVINKIEIIAGKNIDESEVLLSINNPKENFECSISVKKAIAKYFKTGDEIEISVKINDSEEKCISKVRDIIVDSENPLENKIMILKIEEENLKGGEIANINVIKPSEVYDIVVPKSAIVKVNKNSHYVWGIDVEEKAFGDELTVRKIEIEIGESDLKNVVVKNGLNYGVKIVKNVSNMNLAEGNRVILK
jgi:biotin carboxyl carrier protein